MAYQDSNPERRNLVLTSVAFITYFFAGGEFLENTVRLHVINVAFSKPEVLGFIAWTSLLWFLFKYWQVNSEKFINEFKIELNKVYCRDFAVKYVIKCTDSSLDKSNCFVDSVFLKGKKFVIKFIISSWVSRYENTNKLRHYYSKDCSGPVNEHDLKQCEIKDFSGYLLRLRAIMFCCIRYPSFSNYVIPYICFLLAIYVPFSQRLIIIVTLSKPLS